MIETSKNLSNKDKRYLALACRVAEASECNQRHGAVVVKSGSVMSIGLNKWRHRGAMNGKTLTADECANLTVHAEEDAIKRVKTNKAKGATVYVARVNSRGEAVFSRPCDSCHKLMQDSGIKRVVFTE